MGSADIVPGCRAPCAAVANERGGRWRDTARWVGAGAPSFSHSRRRRRLRPERTPRRWAPLSARLCFPLTSPWATAVSSLPSPVSGGGSTGRGVSLGPGGRWGSVPGRAGALRWEEAAEENATSVGASAVPTHPPSQGFGWARLGLGWGFRLCQGRQKCAALGNGPKED